MTTIPKADILLVDDSTSNAELALEALRRERLAERVRVVRDGVEALEYLSAAYSALGELPKVVLLDLRLPRLPGCDVLRRIREDARTRHIPVVVMSSSSDPAEILRCYEEGANSYVVKPVEFDRFAEVVRAVGRYWLYVNRPPVPPCAGG